MEAYIGDKRNGVAISVQEDVIPGRIRILEYMVKMTVGNGRSMIGNEYDLTFAGSHLGVDWYTATKIGRIPNYG